MSESNQGNKKQNLARPASSHAISKPNQKPGRSSYSPNRKTANTDISDGNEADSEKEVQNSQQSQSKTKKGKQSDSSQPKISNFFGSAKKDTSNSENDQEALINSGVHAAKEQSDSSSTRTHRPSKRKGTSNPENDGKALINSGVHAAKEQSDSFSTEGQPSKKQKIPTADTNRTSIDNTDVDKIQLKNNITKEQIDQHILFLNQWKKKTIDKNDAYNTALSFIQWRSNPPYYMRADLNKIYQHEYDSLYVNSTRKSGDASRIIPRYIRSSVHPNSATTTKVIRAASVSKSTDEPESSLYPNTFTQRLTEKKLKITKKPKGVQESRVKEEIDRLLSISSPIPSKSVEGGTIYDKQLQYKNKCLEYISANFKEGKLITVGNYNGYPCLMVHTGIDKILNGLNMANEAEVSRERTEQGFTSFVMSFYSGMVNRLAQEKGISDFIVQRQSFGYNTPSVAETIGSFRINIGIMSPDYMKIHIEALGYLDDILKKFVEEKIPRGESIQGYKSYIESTYSKKKKEYEMKEKEISDLKTNPKNKDLVKSGEKELSKMRATLEEAKILVNKLEENEKSKDWKELAFKTIEKGAKSNTGILNVSRRQENMNYVNVKAFNATDEYKGKDRQEKLFLAFKGSFTNILSSISVKGEELTSGSDEFDNAQYSDKAVIQNKMKDFKVVETHSNDDHQSLQESFKDILADYKKSLEVLPTKFNFSDLDSQGTINNDNFNSLNKKFMELVNNLDVSETSLSNVYDLINDYLVLYTSLSLLKKKTVSNYSYGSESEDGDSDTENIDVNQVDKKGRKSVIIKKIITHNGMRSLLMSIKSAAFIVNEELSKDGNQTTNKQKVTINVKNTYYELEKRLKESYKDIIKIEKNINADIFSRDANPIVIDGLAPKEDILKEMDKIKSKIWVIDITSTDQAKMQEIVDKFRTNTYAKVLYFASSGFKNEQNGAEKNSYGTIRVIADKKQKNVANNSHIIDDILNKIRGIDRPTAEVAHEYRRLLKDLGFVPRNKEIIKKPNTNRSTNVITDNSANRQVKIGESSKVGKKKE